MNVLISLADPEAQRLCEDVLRERGHRVRIEPDGTWAWDAFRSDPFPLAIVDRRITGLDGFELCRRIRSARCPFQPVVWILVEQTDTHDIQMALAAGADNYLVTPVDPQTLHARIAVVERQLGRLANASGPAGPPGEPGSGEAMPPAAALIEAIPDGVLLVDQNGRVIEGNPAAQRLFRRSGHELWQQHLDHLILAGTPPGRSAITSALQTGRWDGPQRLEHARGRRGDGTEFSCEVTASILDDRAAAARWLVLVRETTRRELHDSQIRETAKMKAVATLASGLANDFNNALAAINASIDAARLRGAMEGRETAAELISAVEATRNAARLVRRLLNFARPSPSHRRPITPHSLVEEAENVLKRELDPRHTLVTRLNHGDWHVLADPEQIIDLLASLGYNALEAMPDGGVLTISTSRSMGVTWDTGTFGRGPHREFVRIEVSDTGRGIPPEVMPRIFEPFFSTKESGRGSGMGLSTAYSVLRQHEGGITVESVPGSGASFQVYLPRTLPGVEAPDGAGATRRPEAGTGTILLVDDEKSVRRPLRRALEYCGYEVVEAGDGLEALLVHSRHRDRIRLALLDVKMPRMSGWEVLAELKQREPSLPVILTSGYSKEESTPPAGAVMPDAFLNKPYELVDLAHIVRRLMEKN